MSTAAQIIAWILFGAYAVETLVTPYLIGKKRDDWEAGNVIAALLFACAMFVVALEVSR